MESIHCRIKFYKRLFNPRTTFSSNFPREPAIITSMNEYLNDTYHKMFHRDIIITENIGNNFYEIIL